MQRLVRHAVGLSLLLWVVSANNAAAIPGDIIRNVEAWIQSHPTLRPSPGERLIVNRAETPARRFTFQATPFPVVGSVADTAMTGTIRTEKITLVDTVDGISGNRLEEALRAIYDAVIYNDYRRATVVYRYPNGDIFADDAGRMQRGELREGDRFAYWMNLTTTPEGFTPSGTLTVFLKEDIAALQTDLQNR